MIILIVIALLVYAIGGFIAHQIDTVSYYNKFKKYPDISYALFFIAFSWVAVLALVIAGVYDGLRLPKDAPKRSITLPKAFLPNVVLVISSIIGIVSIIALFHAMFRNIFTR